MDKTLLVLYSELQRKAVMSRQPRTGLNYSKSLFLSKSLPWLGVSLKTSSHYLSFSSPYPQQYSYPSNNQYCQLGWRGFVDEK